MKYGFIALVSVFLTSFVFAPFVKGATSANVTATVTVQNVSVSVSDGSIAYGTVSTGSSADTTSGGVNDSQTATNNGNINEDIDIKGNNSANWTLGATAGADQYVHEFCTANCDSTPVWTALTTSYQSLATAVASSGTQDFDLKITAPSSSSTYTQESITVTVLASAS